MKGDGYSVGQLLASDPDGHSLSFEIVNGPGDLNNLSFSLDADGTLLSSMSFDFETDPTLLIRVGVKDDFGGSTEASFTVFVTNVIEDLDGDGLEDAYDQDDDGDAGCGGRGRTVHV